MKKLKKNESHKSVVAVCVLVIWCVVKGTARLAVSLISLFPIQDDAYSSKEAV